MEVYTSIRLSDATKQKRQMGTGGGKDYLPYITTSEFNSQGTTSVIKDWKTGRGVHCLSRGEMLWYYILRWDDDNEDIREQFPLDVEETVKIANENGWKHPMNEKHVMTMDFLVTKNDGTLHAYSIKANKTLNDRTLQLLCIEKIYWNRRGVPFDILFKTDANRILASNIRMITEFYNANLVFDKESAIKHKIAVKEYKIDLESKILVTDDLGRLWRDNECQTR